MDIIIYYSYEVGKIWETQIDRFCIFCLLVHFNYGSREEKNNPFLPDFNERGGISDSKIIGNYTQANIRSLFDSLDV